MINLWDETIKIITGHGKKWDDVKFILNCFEHKFSSTRSHIFEITKEDFECIAKKLNYDAGYGAQIINPELKIVGDGWWLERHEYDGKEWWDFKIQPTKPTQSINEAKAYLLDLHEKGDMETLFIKWGEI